jgi:hypothetical protein
MAFAFNAKQSSLVAVGLLALAGFSGVLRRPVSLAGISLGTFGFVALPVKIRLMATPSLVARAAACHRANLLSTNR